MKTSFFQSCWRFLSLLILAALLAAAFAPRARAAEPTKAYTLNQLLNAIRTVESGGYDAAIGDNGQAVGPLQIHRAYFIDSGVAGSWEDCLDWDFSCRVFTGYMRRYCPSALEAMDVEVLARTHNGGPSWRKQPHATDRYWAKVKLQLDNEGSNHE